MGGVWAQRHGGCEGVGCRDRVGRAGGHVAALRHKAMGVHGGQAGTVGGMGTAQGHRVPWGEGAREGRAPAAPLIGYLSM